VSSNDNYFNPRATHDPFEHLSRQRAGMNGIFDLSLVKNISLGKRFEFFDHTALEDHPGFDAGSGAVKSYLAPGPHRTGRSTSPDRHADPWGGSRSSFRTSARAGSVRHPKRESITKMAPGISGSLW
jgi:hypothetical protein